MAPMNYAQCGGLSYPAGWCRAYGEEADTPDHVHVLLRWPALTLVRHRRLGDIFPSCRDVRTDNAVAVLAGVARCLQSH